MNTSEVIIGYLAAAGIRHVFGYPGDPSVEFLEAARRAGMSFVLGSREGTAGLMAEAYGQLTGRPGRVPVHARARCHESGQRGGQRLPRPRPDDRDLRPDRRHGASPRSRTRWSTTTSSSRRSASGRRPCSPHTVAAIMRRALRTAMAERPGPVHLTTAADVVGADSDGCRDRAAAAAWPRARHRSSRRAGADIDPVRRLKAARRPVICWPASRPSGAAPVRPLARLAEALDCPVVVAPMAKGILPETHPLYAGTLDMACNGFVWDFLRGADLLLAVGFDAVELIKPWSLTVPTIHIDTVPNTDQIYRRRHRDRRRHRHDPRRLHRRAGTGASRWHARRARGPPCPAARTLQRRARGRAAQPERRGRRSARRDAAPTRSSPPTSARTSCWSARAGRRTRRAAC